MSTHRQAALFIHNPKTKEETFVGHFDQEASIGKSKGASLKLVDLRTSALHAWIEPDFEREQFTLTDLGYWNLHSR